SVIFFFSSRRRHTRSKRDWSSDVCSSDLSGRTSCLQQSILFSFHYFLSRFPAPGGFPPQAPFGCLYLYEKPPKLERFSPQVARLDRKSTRLNSSHVSISYAVYCLKQKDCM